VSDPDKTDTDEEDEDEDEAGFDTWADQWGDGNDPTLPLTGATGTRVRDSASASPLDWGSSLPGPTMGEEVSPSPAAPPAKESPKRVTKSF
jgi:hypothetical protein